MLRPLGSPELVLSSPLRYVVPADLQQLVLDVLDHGPWHVMIRAFLDDERRVARSLTSSPATVDAVIEQTRLMTHEVRNALIPVRHHLTGLAGIFDSSLVRRPCAGWSQRGAAWFECSTSSISSS